MSVTNYYVISHTSMRIPVLTAHGSTPEETAELFCQWAMRTRSIDVIPEAYDKLVRMLRNAAASYYHGGPAIEVGSLEWTVLGKPNEFIRLPITAQAA